MPRQSPYTIQLSVAERDYLEQLAVQYTAPYFEVVRAKIVLYAARGLENQEIAARLDLPRQVVSKWRKRFWKHRLEGLQDAPRSGRPPVFSPSRRRARQSPRL
jgi:transposase